MNADGDVAFKTAYFATKEHAYDNMDPELIDQQLSEIKSDLSMRIDKFQKEGSKWVLAEIPAFAIQFYRVQLQRGGASVTLPKKLFNTKAVLNLDTNECFKWAVLSALHFAQVGNNTRVADYAQWQYDYAWPDAKVVSAARRGGFCEN